MTDEVKVIVVRQGGAVCGSQGYMLKRCENVAAFYLDGWGDTGRIYPISLCNSTWTGTELVDCPSMTIKDGTDECISTEIYFPEFEGWRIHSVSGGKTMAICLVKD